jgi:hypothetical protein
VFRRHDVAPQCNANDRSDSDHITMRTGIRRRAPLQLTPPLIAQDHLVRRLLRNHTQSSAPVLCARWNPASQQETVQCLVELGADPSALPQGAERARRDPRRLNLLVGATMTSAPDHEATRNWLQDQLRGTAQVGLT